MWWRRFSSLPSLPCGISGGPAKLVKSACAQSVPSKVVVIPQSAIAIDQTGPYVFVVGENNAVEQRRLKLGTGREGFAVVQDGDVPALLRGSVFVPNPFTQVADVSAFAERPTPQSTSCSIVTLK